MKSLGFYPIVPVLFFSGSLDFSLVSSRLEHLHHVSPSGPRLIFLCILSKIWFVLGLLPLDGPLFNKSHCPRLHCLQDCDLFIMPICQVPTQSFCAFSQISIFLWPFHQITKSRAGLDIVESLLSLFLVQTQAHTPWVSPHWSLLCNWIHDHSRSQKKQIKQIEKNKI